MNLRASPSTSQQNSSITQLDGPRGRMFYRGYDCLALAGRTTYEEAVYLLWEGRLPTAKQLSRFSKVLKNLRALPTEVLGSLRRLPAAARPMDVLQITTALMGVYDPETSATSMTARMPTIVAAWDRIRRGKEPVDPDPSLGHAANFLRMLTGRRPAPLDVEALDLYLVMLADHDLNASTLAGRVAASTLSDFYSSISAAIGALKGPLHGGANEKVMEMLIEVGDESRAEAYAEKALAQKRRIMGFGHRVFKSEDPRSRLLQEMARKLSVKKGETKWFRIAAKLEEAVSRRKRIRVNVDFYSAPLLHLLGIPWDLFPAVFAVSRIAGWSVHFVEQVGQNRLIHPLSRYTGPAERTFVPLERRGSS